MKPQRTFTQEEINTIKALYEEGVSIKTIAKGIHCDDRKLSQFIRDKYGPNSIQLGRKKNIIENPDRDIHISVDMALAIASEESNKIKPPVGNEWKPWMIPTEVYIPDDPKNLNWIEYAADYDRRKRICDMRNKALK